MGNSSRRDTAKARLFERRAKALQLRKMGHTFEEIAKLMNYSHKRLAARDVKEAIQDIIREPAQELIEYEKMRLDDLLRGIYLEACKGNLKAIDRVIRIMERRSALLGLDAPKRSETTFSAMDGAGHIVNVVLSEPDEPKK